MTTCRFFDEKEFRAQEDARLAALKEFDRRHPAAAGGWPPEKSAVNATFFPPGSMWYCRWWHDPDDPDDVASIDRQIADLRAGAKNKFLNIHYLTTWARIRPPICVVCPGGVHWCPDQGSSNGDGWTVTGTVPSITAMPSIWTEANSGSPREYHGWLREGVFHPA